MKKTLRRNELLVEALTRDYSSTQQQLEHLLEESLKLTGSEYGCLYVYDEETEGLVLTSWSHKVLVDCKVRQTFKAAGLWGESIRRRKPLVVNDPSVVHAQIP